MVSNSKELNMSVSLSTTLVSLVAVLTMSIPSTVTCFDITKLLSQYPAFGSFSNYLTQTQLAGEVNTRAAITVLAVDNAGMAPVSGKSMDVIKKVLSLHVILDYFDVQKFQHLGNQTITVTTLFQASGQADALQGFMHITDLTTGAVTFISAADPKCPGANLIKAIVAQPYNISVVQVSTVIMPPSIVGDGNGNGNASSPYSNAPTSPVIPVPVKSPVPVVLPVPVKSPVPVVSPVPVTVPVPVHSPVPVVSPMPVTTPVPVKSPVPVLSPVPVTAPIPVKSPVPVVSPVPVKSPIPVVSPVPVATPVPVVSPVPVTTPVPVVSPVPVTSPVPVVSPVPVTTPVPVASPVPVTTPVPVKSPVPVVSPVPVAVPVPVPVSPSGGGGGASDAPGAANGQGGGDGGPNSGVAHFGVNKNKALSIVLTLLCMYVLSSSSTVHM